MRGGIEPSKHLSPMLSIDSVPRQSTNTATAFQEAIACRVN